MNDMKSLLPLMSNNDRSQVLRAIAKLSVLGHDDIADLMNCLLVTTGIAQRALDNTSDVDVDSPLVSGSMSAFNTYYTYYTDTDSVPL